MKLTLRRKTFRVNGVNVVLIDNPYPKWPPEPVAGEKITEGDLVYIGDDGKVYALRYNERGSISKEPL